MLSSSLTRPHPASPDAKRSADGSAVGLDRWFLISLLVASVGISSALAYKTWNDRRSRDGLELHLSLAQREVQRGRVVKAALLASIRNVPLGGAPLTGVDVSTNSLRYFKGTPDGVYYLLDPECAACAENLPLLDSLSRHGGVRVLALAPYDSAEVVRYLRLHSAQVPVLVSVHGLLIDIFPRYLTPITAVVRAGALQNVLEGLIDSSNAASLTAVEGRGMHNTPWGGIK